ncbi:MAG: FAD-dependent oxidoreductase [Bacteroidetes bacterium]|nr:FAD-dependent oxidoreductase [Bacteroidota bacterium]
MNRTVAILGAGPAGMEAAACLSAKGFEVWLIEEGLEVGGHLNCWDRLFPTKRPGQEVMDYLLKGLKGVNILTSSKISEITGENERYRIKILEKQDIIADAVLICTGFIVFDATRKEEYGYGIYDNVITSVDLESRFREKKEIRMKNGEIPKKIGMVHCVGSRDEKVGNIHCSKVCCVTAVKQAIELKEAIPSAQLYCFYMDLRMFGLGYEELYKESQEKWGVQFLRGRLSEAFENQDGTLRIRIEDTLTAKPLRMDLDMLVLLVGFLPSAGTRYFSELLHLQVNPNGFLQPLDEHTLIHDTVLPGIFLAGSCKGPKNVEETLADARSSVIRLESYLAKRS